MPHHPSHADIALPLVLQSAIYLTKPASAGNGKVHAAWSIAEGIEVGTYDYIAVSWKGSGKDDYVTYEYNAQGARSGTVVVDMSGSLQGSRECVLRYFLYSGKVPCTSAPFGFVQAAPPKAGRLVVVKKAHPAKKIRVEWTLDPNADTSASDFIGICKDGSAPSSYHTYA